MEMNMKNATQWMPAMAGALVLAAMSGCTITGSGGGTNAAGGGMGSGQGLPTTSSGGSGTASTGAARSSTTVATGAASGQTTAGTATTRSGMSSGASTTAASSTTTASTSTTTTTTTTTAATSTAAAAAPAFGASSTVFYPTGHEANAALRVDRVCPPEVVAGGNFSYELRVTNVTRVALENVMVTETVPSNFTMVSSEPAANTSGGAATFNLGSIAPGATKTVRVTGRAGQAGSISSCATVSYTLPICCTINVVAPSLKIEKMMLGSAQGGTVPSLCDNIPVRIVVSNPGTGTARNVMVTDALPAGMTTADGKQNVEFSAGDLAAGQSKTFEFMAKASRTGSFTNDASAKAENGLTAESNKVTVNVQNCNLVIAKRADRAQLFAGRPASFTIEVRNTGDGVARNVVVEDMIPAGASFVSATEGGRVAGNVATWSFGDMAPGASKTMQIVLNPGSNEVVTNTARIRSVCCPEAQATATVNYEGVPAIVVELVDEPDPLLVGEETTFTVKVRNQGIKADTNLRVVFNLANGLTFVSGQGASAVSGAGQAITFGVIPTLAPKQEVVWTVKARCTAANGDVRSNLNVTTDFFKAPITEIESTNLVQ
jgi:uncharacterized repeat protein (TIGR01451 family)